MISTGCLIYLPSSLIICELQLPLTLSDWESSATTNIAFEAPFNYKPAEERQYLFDHVWRQVADKFYDPKMQGVDWEYYRFGNGSGSIALQSPGSLEE